jgi:signal transduction histidine kinase
MNRLFPPSRPTGAREKPQQDDTRLSGTQLIFARMACLAAGLLSFVVFVASVPATYEALLSQFCTGTLCNHPSPVSVQFVQQLQVLGLPVPAYALYLIVLNSIFVCIYFIVALIFLWRRFDDWMALFASFFLMTFALNFTSNTMVAPPSWVYQFVLFLGAASIVIFFYLFPTGRFVPRWTRWLSIGAILFWGLKYFLPPFAFNPYNNLIFVSIGFLVFVGGAIIAQVYRYLRISNSIQRQQTKWVVFGVSIAVGGYIVCGLIFTIFFPSVSQSPLADILFTTINYLLLLLLPISLAFAILRSRLWDIDIIINRTLVYGILTASVVAIYVLVVGSLGTLFQAMGNLLISFVATGLVAVLFSPLRQHLQHGVNRLMYGERDDPYRVIARLGQRVEGTLAAEAVLPTIVETVAQALKLPYAAITLKQEESLAIATEYLASGQSEEPHAPLLRLPLVYQTEQVGELVLAPRAAGETFTSADQRLLEDLAHQIGVAVHAVQLTADLQRLTVDLQHSRERLVIAREEERRRLRRDLHDGIGPTLASLFQRLDTARRLVPHDPDAAVLLLDTLKGQVKTTIAEIRRVVYALRPPVLDELGLISALREHTAYAQESNGLLIVIEAPEAMPPLPAAVEVAAYRIILEALTNVERHAHAHTCLVRLDLTEAGALCLDITDDGCGLSAHSTAGVGLTSIRERAAELGGACKISAEPTGGTRVWVRLPLAKE